VLCCGNRSSMDWKARERHIPSLAEGSVDCGLEMSMEDLLELFKVQLGRINLVTILSSCWKAADI
jgi:hypothetical protein